MKSIVIIILLLLVSLSSVHGRPLRLQRQQQRQQNLQPPVRPNPDRPNARRPAVRQQIVLDAIYSFYVRQFEMDPEFTPEIRSKILPSLDQFLQDRFEISERRQRALNQLRQTIANNGSDDDLNRLKRELDSADAEFQANHVKFLNNVDPMLNARQQAKLRLLQNQADNQLRQYLNAIQNPNATNAQRRANQAPAK